MDNSNVNHEISENRDHIAVMLLSPALMVNNFIDLGGFDLDEALAVVEGESGCVVAACESYVSKLPTVNEVKRDEVCAVCMERFSRRNEEGEKKRVPCGHVYHSSCITIWLEHCNSCPLCRRRILF
ncbi:E3 ubiquitin-protein ligase RING1-like [Vigna unguiculata]|uniref:RING-type E3 ubiquitin transferase n=1 Tax=Vigna unguiculata TaxID=3917 RepID=A0A4D6L9P0_VIGUN|nr:E3 ubiquitin-protein ligase RING1-like [Vigna unguiculata]QCD85241.1 E3 ubiquitin-protein ligase [Vigna unguiculata]